MIEGRSTVEHSGAQCSEEPRGAGLGPTGPGWGTFVSLPCPLKKSYYFIDKPYGVPHKTSHELVFF